MRIELHVQPGRYEYEDLREGDIFSDGGEFYVMHLSEGHLAAVSLHTGKELSMKGTAVVTLYDKKFIYEK